MNKLILLSIALIVSIVSAEKSDSYNPPPPSPESPLWMFTINPDNPLKMKEKNAYSPIEEYDESMEHWEMSLLRKLQNEGIDFIGVWDSMISITEESYYSAGFSFACCYKTSDKVFLFVKQTEENQLKILEYLKRIAPVKAEPVGAGQRR